MKTHIGKIWDEHSIAMAIILTVLLVIGYLACCFGIMCLQSWLIMLLWNWVMVDLFSAPVLSFWMAFGLRWLCDLLFKSKITANKNSED